MRLVAALLSPSAIAVSVVIPCASCPSATKMLQSWPDDEVVGLVELAVGITRFARDAELCCGRTGPHKQGIPSTERTKTPLIVLIVRSSPAISTPPSTTFGSWRP